MNTVRTPASAASAASAQVRWPAMPRRRRAGSTATPTISVTSPRGLWLPPPTAPSSGSKAPNVTVRPAAIMADSVSTWESGSVARASRSATEAGPIWVSSWPNPTWIGGLHGGEVRVVGREAAYGDRAAAARPGSPPRTSSG